MINLTSVILLSKTLETANQFFKDRSQIDWAINPLVPDASERPDKPFSLQIQKLEVNLKWNCRFLFFAPWELMG